MESWGIRILRLSPPSTLTPRVVSSRHPRAFSTSPPPPATLRERRRAKRLGILTELSAAKKSKAPVKKARNVRFVDLSIMSAVLQLVTVPSADTPHTCISLRHDRGHYIFGRVGEGTQRAFNTRKVTFGNVTQIFLSSSVGWDQLGGILGFLLTIASAVTASKEAMIQENAERRKKGRKTVEIAPHAGVGIHAADNLSHVLAAGRSFIFRQSTTAHIFEHRDDPRAADPTDTKPDWQDETLRVWKIPAARERSSSPRKRRLMSADADEEKEPETSLSDDEVARIIVERALWNGDTNNEPLVSRRVRDLKPDDIAFILDDGVPRRYKAEHGEEDPDRTVWVIPSGDSDELPQGTQKRPLQSIPLPPTSYSRYSMSYIAKTYDRRGKFDRAAADALGVDRHDFKKLIAGDAVKGKDGKTVTSDMVLADSLPGQGFIVADIPSPDFLESFMQRPEWQNEELMANIPVMYWLLGSGMADNTRIRKFMDDRPSIRHIICAPETSPNMISNPGAAELQMKLRRVDPDRFPIPTYDNAVSAPAPAAESNVEFARAGKRVQIMPRVQHIDDTIAPFADLVTPFNSVSDKALELAAEARARASNPSFLAKLEQDGKNTPSRDAEVICLGTGSSVPSKHRNVSSTLIRAPGIGNYLLDCGEGTLGQIRRLYGDAETANILRDLRAVAISHMHADHHLGAVSVLRAWYEQTLQDGSNACLAVICIARYLKTLQEVSQVEDFGLHRLRFPNCEPGALDVSTPQNMSGEDFGLRAARLIPVQHCVQSKAVELELSSGLRVAYSGDCRPSKEFARICRGAHLLIHECTFDDDKADHAYAKKHSTMSEALGVARDMKAQRTILTHFSQRYVKSDSLRGKISDDMDGSVLLAFDHMAVKLGDFRKAACYLPALEQIMSESTD